MMIRINQERPKLLSSIAKMVHCLQLSELRFFGLEKALYNNGMNKFSFYLQNYWNRQQVKKANKIKRE